MAPVQLNKLANVAEETSCQGKNVSSRINKENLSLEQAIELSYLSMKTRRWKINLTLNQTMKKLYGKYEKSGWRQSLIDQWPINQSRLDDWKTNGWNS